MHGLLACGETSWQGTAIRCATSAVAQGDCGTCMFISLPSKSALSRKVEPPITITTTRWPIMPIRYFYSWIPQGSVVNTTEGPFSFMDERFLPPPPVFFPSESPDVRRSASLGFPPLYLVGSYNGSRRVCEGGDL